MDPASGEVTGHWVAVRGFDGSSILLANPGGTGPKFGQQALDRMDFQKRGSFSAVFIEVDGATPVTLAGKRFRVANTDGEGANVRSEPNATAAKIGAVREGATVGGADHAWRRVTDAAGTQGWIASEFLLARADGRFHVIGTDGQGANLRREPDTAAERITLLAEGSELSAEEHAWRRITLADGTTGWVAEAFLVGAQ